MKRFEEAPYEGAWPRIVTIGMTAVATLVVISTLCVILRSAHPVILGDAWEMIDLFESYGRGESTFSQYWAVWNQHRILFPKMLYLLDRLGADGTGFLLVFLNLVLLGVTAGLFAGALGRHPDFSRNEKWYFSSLAVSLCFWLILSGSMLWGFQIAWFLNGAAIGGACFLVCDLHDRRTRAGNHLRMAGALLCGVVASYSLASGILIWPILAVVLLRARVRPRWLGIWAGGGVLTVAGYFAGYQTPSSHMKLERLVHPETYQYLIVLLGNPLSRIDLIAGGLAGAVGLALFLAFVPRFFVASSPGFFARFAFAQAVYAFGTAAITAVGRGHSSLSEHATSSRYYFPVLLFWFFTVVIAYTEIRKRSRVARFLYSTLFAMVPLILVLGQVISVPERKIRYVRTDDAALALVSHVRDSTALLSIMDARSIGPHLWERNDFLRESRLSVYREAWTRSFDAEADRTYAKDARVPLRAEIVDVRAAVPGPGRFIKGRITAPPGERLPEILVFVEHGRIRGFAKTRGRTCEGCFSGYVAGKGELPFSLFALDSPDSRSLRAVVLP